MQYNFVTFVVYMATPFFVKYSMTDFSSELSSQLIYKIATLHQGIE